MAKIDIFSGFLGAGKTTLIKKLISEGYRGEKLVLIENEFGDIGIDGGFLKESGIEITEMNSGCICCSLVGDFGDALKKVLKEFSPDRILIEPSGVGKLSDVIKAVENINEENAVLNGLTTVADASKCKMYMKNFGEFFNDQLKNAKTIILSHTESLSSEKLEESLELIRQQNSHATIITTPITDLDGQKIKDAIEKDRAMDIELEGIDYHHKHEHHHEHHHGEDCNCTCHEHHHDHEHSHEHEHHHEHEHQHEHEHHHGENCTCTCHEHHHDHEHCHEHEHHHHADEVFSSIGVETTKVYSTEKLKTILESLNDTEKYGMVIRAKGIVESKDKEWIYFDYIPHEADIRYGSPSIIGKLCIIGSKINEAEIKKLFEIS